MQDIEKSDHMICNTRKELAYKYNRLNDELFLQHFGKTLPHSLKDIDMENKARNGKDERTYCDYIVHTRGNNGTPPVLDKAPCVGYDCYTPYHLNDFLLVPCTKNTFRNYLVQDEHSICTAHHQLFTNLTKRKDYTLAETLKM